MAVKLKGHFQSIDLGRSGSIMLEEGEDLAECDIWFDLDREESIIIMHPLSHLRLSCVAIRSYGEKR